MVSDCTHRLKYVVGEKKDYKKFNEVCNLDTPITKNINNIVLNAELPIVIVTGRSGNPDVMEKTKAWLLKNNIAYVKIYFRPENEMDPAPICKLKLLNKLIEDGYKPVLAYDDDKRCVDMFKANGINSIHVEFHANAENVEYRIGGIPALLKDGSPIHILAKMENDYYVTDGKFKWLISKEFVHEII